MPEAPVIKRMKLPSFLKRGDVWIRLCIEMKRDREFKNLKAIATLESTVYVINGKNYRLPIAKQMGTKVFSARGCGYDKICNAAAQALCKLQRYAASQGIWLPLGARYTECMGWYNLDRYFRSMFKDNNTVIPREEKCNTCLTAECFGLRQRPKLGYCKVNSAGRYVYYLDEYCMRSLIRYDNAELLGIIREHNEQKPCK